MSLSAQFYLISIVSSLLVLFYWLVVLPIIENDVWWRRAIVYCGIGWLVYVCVFFLWLASVRVNT